MQKTVLTVLNNEGQPAPGATVRVRHTYGGTDATLYADDHATTIANPISADVSGLVSFKCFNGIYDIIINSGAGTKTIPALKISDGAALYVLTCGTAPSIPYGAACYFDLSNPDTARLATWDSDVLTAQASCTCVTVGGVAAGNVGVFSGPGTVRGLSGLARGESAWLGANGAIVNIPPDPVADSGKWAVCLGNSLSHSTRSFFPAAPIYL